MIVEFSVKNFRSIKEMQTISFVATGLKSAEKYAEVDANNIADADDMRLFKTLGIYGANASGKSNVIKALDLFTDLIRKEPSSISSMGTLCDPFLYQENPTDTESFFQIVMIIDGIKYRYGLTVKKNIVQKGILNLSKSNEIVTNEWLYGRKKKNMRMLFQRKHKEVVSNLESKENIPSALSYEHSLYLKHAAAFDEKGECQLICNHLKLFFWSGLNTTNVDFRDLSILLIEKSIEEKKTFLDILNTFNLRYTDIELEKNEYFNMKHEVFPQDKIYLIKKFSAEKDKVKKIRLNLKNNESEGTKKLFDLSGLLLAAFNYGYPISIILDEIDSNFHPSLLIKLIGLFNDPKINKSNSQLLFTSHDTNLMSPAIMRRDQFYFTEKKEDESTRLYSLADLKGIRNDADFAKQYLAGYYGAVPVLEDYTLETVEQ